jgi:hypothetical protein
MFKPVPVAAALCLGYSALAGYECATSATSDEAIQVCKAASRVLRDREGSEVLYGNKATALSRMSEVVESLVIDDDQDAVPADALRNARQLLLALPDDLQLPQVGIDPDGAISLTWTATRDRMFSVSVSGSERLAYAWIDGSDKGHAVERFRAPSLPARFLSNLRAIISNDVAVLWAA